MLKHIDYKAFFDNKISSEELRGDVSTIDMDNTHQSEINKRAIEESLNK